MIFIKNKRIIEQQAAEIRMLSSQWQTQRDEIETLTNELDRTRAAADRQAIVLNRRAEQDDVIKRDLVHTLAVMIASGNSSALEIPQVPEVVVDSVVLKSIEAKRDRGIEPQLLVMNDWQIRCLQSRAHCPMPSNADSAEMTYFGIKVVRK